MWPFFPKNDAPNRENPDHVYVCGYCRRDGESLRKVVAPGRCVRMGRDCAGETYLVLNPRK